MRQRGFTLLEMTIVILIIGLLIGMAAPVLNDMANRSRNEATVGHLDLIEAAMAVFAQRNGRLPCPGAPDASTVGNERATCATAATAVGIVPFRTLGLSEDLARDGYRNMITYVVAPQYAATSDAASFCGVLNASLTVNDADGVPVTDEMVAFALVSHGENGAGAYVLSGMTQIDLTSGSGVSPSAFENENADLDAILVLTGDIAEGATNGPYDDSLRIATQDGIGALMRDEGCDGDTDSVTNLELIEDALVRFLRRNGRLPCPGAPNATPLGFERATCTTNNTLEGVVPFRTLGLPENNAKDGFGHYLTYRVAANYPALASATNSIVNFCGVNAANAASTLTVNDENGTSVTPDPIAVVVLSHGANGFGFYQVPANSRYSSGGGDAQEDENADGDTTFIEGTRAVDGYDDILGWWTAEELALLANPGEGCDFRDTTDDNLSLVQAALVEYLRRNGELPCPAQPQDYDPDAGDPLGIARTTCNNTTDDGVVPFRTLGLPQATAYDGYGRLFSYHVDEDYTVTGDIATFCAETSHAVEVVDYNGSDVVPSFTDTPIVYVLVSHGQNGFGHFEQGQSNRVGANTGTPDEDENADSDEDFVDSPEIASGTNDGYDDETRWETRDAMAQATGNPCP